MSPLAQARASPWPAVGTSVLATLVLTYWATIQLEPADVAVGVVLILAALILGIRPIRLTGLKLAVTPIHFFVLMALIEFGLATAVAAAVAGVTGAAIAPERPVRRIHLAFNVGSITTSTLAAHASIRLLGVWFPAQSDWLPITVAVATASFALANSCLVAIAVSISEGRSFPRMWADALLSESWCHPVGMLVTVIVVIVLDAFALIVFSIVASSLWLAFVAHRRSH